MQARSSQDDDELADEKQIDASKSKRVMTIVAVLAVVTIITTVWRGTSTATSINVNTSRSAKKDVDERGGGAQEAFRKVDCNFNNQHHVQRRITTMLKAMLIDHKIDPQGNLLVSTKQDTELVDPYRRSWQKAQRIFATPISSPFLCTLTRRFVKSLTR